MNKIILPASINPPRFRKDGSVSLSFDSRELTTEEMVIIMALRNIEGWLCFSPNPDEPEIPEENANLDMKSPSERLRAVMFILFTQEVKAGKFTGVFQTFYNEKMEQLIQFIKNKLDK